MYINNNLPDGIWWRANHSPYMVPPFVQLISWFSFTWKLTTALRQLHDHLSITIAVGRLFLIIAISMQLNEPSSYGISLGNYHGNRPYQPYSTRDFVCALVSLPDQWLFGNETRVCMRTTFEKGILRNGQQPGRAENSFIDQGEFVPMKTLSRCQALCCDKHQFCDKMTLEPFSRYHCSTLWS